MGSLLKNLLHATSVLALWAVVAALAAVFVAQGAWPICLVTPFVVQIGALGACALLGHVLFAPATHRGRTLVVRAIGLAVPAIVAAIVLFGAFERKVPAMDGPSAGGRGVPLSVLVCNVYSDNRDSVAVGDLIAARDPDVVLLLELNERWIAALKPRLVRWPHHQERADEFGNFGIGIWSKHPIVAGGIVVHGTEVPQIEVDLRVTAGDATRIVRFFGLHPLPPVSRRAHARRSAVLQRVAERCATSEHPTVVAGDFNASPYCDDALRLAARGGLLDATAGLHRTWPSDRALLPFGIRIDHVWGSRQVRCVGASRESYLGSDHFPVFARLVVE